IEVGLAWWQFAAATVRARLAMALRLTMAVLLVLALLGVGVPQVVDRQATVFVADVSSSAQDSQPRLVNFVTQALAAKRPDDAYALVSTARTATVEQGLTRVVAPVGTGEGTAVPARDGTDLAA